MPAELLLVDDEAGIRNLFINVAGRLGYEVTAVETVDAFLDSYRASTPTVIVMDLMIPGTDGVELMNMLADAGSDVPIVLISGSEGKLLDRARRLGEARGLNIRAILAKPIMLEDLEAVLDDAA